MHEKQRRPAVRSRGCCLVAHPTGEGQCLEGSIPKNVPRFDISDQRWRAVPTATIWPSHLHGHRRTYSPRQDAWTSNEGVPGLYRALWFGWNWKEGHSSDGENFSEEKLPENRNIALDLLVGVIERLNGDLQKFARLCGNSNLSHKAKELIEERWAKHEQQPAAGGKSGNVTSRPRKTATSSLRSSARSSGIPGLSPGSGKRDRARAGTSALSLRKEGDNDDEVDAFPTLKLNLDDAAYSSSAERSANPLSNITAGEEMISPTPREELFTFQYSGRRNSNEAPQVEPTVEAKRITSATEEMVTSSASIAASGEQSSAGVSSLRERLAKLRSRKGGGAEGGEGSSVIHDAGSGDNDDVGTTNNDEEDHEAAKNLPTINVRSAPEAKAQQDSTVMSRIDKLMLQPIPLAEDDPAIKSVEESLRTIHAAVSGKGGDNADAIKSDLIGQTPQFLTQMSR